MTIDWGDGTPLDTTGGMIDAAGGNFTVRGSHTYAQVGHYSATVTISDETPTGSIPASVVTVIDPVTVTDAALTATATGPVDATAGTPLETGPLVTFTDAGLPGAAGDYEATIDWGDGTPATPGQITVDEVRRLLRLRHSTPSRRPAPTPAASPCATAAGAVTTAAFHDDGGAR